MNATVTPPIFTPAIFEGHSRVTVAMTTADPTCEDGFSFGRVGFDPSHNLATLAEWMGGDPALIAQQRTYVHGQSQPLTRTVFEPGWQPDETNPNLSCDSIVTQQPGIILVCSRKDAPSSLVYSETAGSPIIGIAMSGWKTLAMGNLDDFYAALSVLGADLSQTLVWITDGVCRHQLPQTCLDELRARYAFTDEYVFGPHEEDGVSKASLDLNALTRRIHLEAGVPESNINSAEELVCNQHTTDHEGHPLFYSARRDGASCPSNGAAMMIKA